MRVARVLLGCLCALAATAGCGSDDEADPGPRAEFELEGARYQVEVAGGEARILRWSPVDDAFEEAASTHVNGDPFLYAGRAEGDIHAILIAPAGTVVDPPPRLVGDLHEQSCGPSLCVGFLLEPGEPSEAELVYQLDGEEGRVPLPAPDVGSGSMTIKDSG